nr:MAG TPA: Zinc-finger double domain protein [Caudoviricetes sp.]
MKRYYDKRPKEPRKRMHYNKRGIAKHSFRTEAEALRFVKKCKLTEYTPYLCEVCGYWHIGRRYKR